MTDRELLELAAKAVGYWNKQFNCYEGPMDWDALENNDDAFWLMVKLGISITPYPIYSEKERHSVIVKQRRASDTMREVNPTEVVEVYGEDKFSATRRAIVCCAAEIGRRMEQ